MKFKNQILILLLLSVSIYSLVGCAKCVSTVYETVDVNITEKYYKPSYTTVEYNVIFKQPMPKFVPAVYRITVEYNGVEHTFSGSDVYNKYKDKVGQSATGKLEIRTYDDGAVIYDIVSLE